MSGTNPHRNLESKVGTFLSQLESTEQGDVECNAEILAEIIKSFAVTFSVEIDDIVDIIQSTKGPLNIEVIRAQLLAKSNEAEKKSKAKGKKGKKSTN